MKALPLSLITLSAEAESLSFHAMAVKLYADIAPDRSAQHLQNMRVIHSKIGQMLADSDKAPAPVPAGSPDAWRG